MRNIEFAWWKAKYMADFQGRMYCLELQRHIKYGFFNLSPGDVDKMIETLDVSHVKKYVAVI